MARFVKLADGSGVCLYRNDIPLYCLRDSLPCRRCNRFADASGLLKAVNIWNTTDLLVPAEYLVFQDLINDRFQCSVWEWWTVYYFPAGILTPIPPSVYYFFDSIRSTKGTALEFWYYVTRVEYAQLFASF